ncbi:MAG: response regulator [Synergistaceae bacterium]|nr:response regulator [Synergistaceae bacterium]
MLSFFNIIDATFIEITMIPFLFILTIFLGGRMATNQEINRRFLLLVISTLIAVCFEVFIEIFTDMAVNSFYMKLFYFSVNVNGFCLMYYVAAYTRSTSRRLIRINLFLLAVSLISLFIFGDNENIYMMFSPGFAIFFVTEGFILQLIYQKYYANGQFIVMNLLFVLLIDSFVIQYLFNQNIPLVYTVATMMLYFTFFYLEAQTYARLLTAHQETEQARIQTEESIRQAKLANQAKSTFLASTSHEIRTPMNAILGINDMILNENPEPESRQAALAIKKSGEYLLNLVNNILDISKIEAGKMDLFETDYHLCELLKECEDFVIEKLGKNNNIRFILDVDENMSEHLNGDVLRLKQALINLLDNAVKYTRKGSITLKVQGDRTDKIIIVSFIIQDTGLGMKEENLKHIFEPFERANIAETRSILGAGLGLTLVKNVVDIMNGTINIESSYGEGTKVTMNLYQKIASSDDFTVKEYEQEMMTNAQNLPVEDENTKNEWPDAKILVVDDTPVNLVVAKGMLKDSRAKIETSESGEDALEKMKSEKFDIVFLDHKMPGMDGIETLGRAKKISPDTKYIALTANAGVNARNEYIELGFDDYLPKPFKSLEMIKILKTFLKG